MSEQKYSCCSLVSGPQIFLRCLGSLENLFSFISGNQAEMRALDNIVLACTNNNLVHTTIFKEIIKNL